MKIWDKVTLVWDYHITSLPTSVCMDGSFDPDALDPHVFSQKAQERVHGLFRMSAVSQPRDREDDQRKGEMILDIRRQCGPNIPPNSDAIRRFLEEELNDLRRGAKRPNENGVRIKSPSTKSWTDTIFTLSFVLANREQFCDTAIDRKSTRLNSSHSAKSRMPSSA